MAPERVKQNTVAAPGDIWSLGITVIEMLQKKPPYFHDTPHTALCKIANYDAPTLNDIGVYTEELRGFLSSCLVVDVDGRKTATQLLRVRMSITLNEVEKLMMLV